jgi:hypothetical protein
LLVLVYASGLRDLPELLAGSVGDRHDAAGRLHQLWALHRRDGDRAGRGVAVLILEGGPYRFTIASAVG